MPGPDSARCLDMLAVDLTRVVSGDPDPSALTDTTMEGWDPWPSLVRRWEGGVGAPPPPRRTRTAVGSGT